MSKDYDPVYEECMGCTSERCRGAAFMDVELASGKVGLLCPACAEQALTKAANSASSMVRIAVKRVLLRVLESLLDGAR